MHEITVKTNAHTQFLNVDRQIQAILDAAGYREGAVVVFVPHTTAGITINENADPDVVADLKVILERAVPWQAGYAHGEGNSAAHAKASMMGFSQTVLVRDGRLQFGTWQSLYLCEFDGPRNRQIWIRLL
jgi:secondary thiamine-phosphate synthase enzyme